MLAHVTLMSKSCSYEGLKPYQEPHKGSHAPSSESSKHEHLSLEFGPLFVPTVRCTVYLCQPPTDDWSSSPHWLSQRVHDRLPLNALRSSMCSIIAQHWLVAESSRLCVLLSRDDLMIISLRLVTPLGAECEVSDGIQVSSLPLLIRVGRLA